MRNSKGQFVKGIPPWNKGKHPDYVQGENHPRFGKKHTPEAIEKMRAAATGESHGQWRGGFTTLKNGRVRNNKEMKFRYRMTVEEILGRPLLRREIIHHINENKSDDRPENLFLFRHATAHNRWHEYLKRNKLSGTLLKSNLSLYSVK